ncbi:hypothetical protein, partial [Salmonella enterica]|uniref:hypothetical protein n=1 Tax=Salmonella enterica TaxID=28901 RepID=UPI00329A2C59
AMLQKLVKNSQLQNLQSILIRLNELDLLLSLILTKNQVSKDYQKDYQSTFFIKKAPCENFAKCSETLI